MRETTIHVVAAAIHRAGTCLATQRSRAMPLPGKWEFPGGKIEPGESPPDALAREIREELDLRIEVRELLGRGTAVDGDARVVLDVYAAELQSGRIALREHAACRWLEPAELADLDWAAADLPVLDAVRRWLESKRRG